MEGELFVPENKRQEKYDGHLLIASAQKRKNGYAREANLPPLQNVFGTTAKHQAQQL